MISVICLSQYLQITSSASSRYNLNLQPKILAARTYMSTLVDSHRQVPSSLLPISKRDKLYGASWNPSR